MATLGSKLSYRLPAITAEKPESSVPNTAQVLMQRASSKRLIAFKTGKVRSAVP